MIEVPRAERNERRMADAHCLVPYWPVLLIAFAFMACGGDDSGGDQAGVGGNVSPSEPALLVPIDPTVEAWYIAIEDEISFELQVPTALGSFNLTSDQTPQVAGPPTMPFVTTQFVDGASVPPRILDLAQSAQPFPDGYEASGESVTVGDWSGTISRKATLNGETLQLRWQQHDVYLELVGSNVTEEELLDFAISITPISSVRG